MVTEDIVIRTNEVFKASIKNLGIKYMSKLWGRGKRHIYAWAADPEHCEYNCPDPLEKIHIMLSSLQKEGHADIIEAALSLLVKDLGYQILPDQLTLKDKIDSFSSEFFKLVCKIGNISMYIDSYNKEEFLLEKDKRRVDILIQDLKTQLMKLETALRESEN